MFLGFANFYRRFIQGFSQIVIRFTLILKTSRSTEYLTRPGEGIVGVRGDSRAECDGSKLDGSEMDNDEVNGSEVDNEVGKKVQKTSRSKKLSKSKKTVRSSDYLTPGAKLAFIKLR